MLALLPWLDWCWWLACVAFSLAKTVALFVVADSCLFVVCRRSLLHRFRKQPQTDADLAAYDAKPWWHIY